MMQDTRPRWFAQPSWWFIAIGIAVLVGATIPAYVDTMGDSLGKLMALPALIALVIMTAFSRSTLFLIIVLLRGSTESLFTDSRFSIAGAQIGLGGLLNAFAIVIAALLVFEKPQLFSKAIMKTWGAWLIVCLVGVAAAPEPGDAIRLMLQLLSNFAVFVAAFYFVRSDEDFRSCIKIVLWSSLVPAIYGVIQYAMGTGFYTPDAGQRANSTFSHPNVFAFYVVLIISLTFYILKSGTFKLNNFLRIAFVLYLMLLAVLLVLTKTRSAWIAAVAFFFAYGLFFKRRYLVYLLVGGACSLFIPEIGDRLIDLTQGGSEVISSKQTLNSFAWRVSLWTSALDAMEYVHYLQGYGLEAFFHNSPTFFAESGGANWGAHNVYMEIFYDLGLLGIGAFLWLYGRLLGTLKGMLAFDRLGAFTLMFVIVEYLVVCASDNMLHYLSFNWYLWFLYGAGASLVEVHRDKKPVAGPQEWQPVFN